MAHSDARDFETPDGVPIAVYYNYAVHGVIAGQLDEVSGDRTLMVTLTNGTANSGYVPHDAAFGYHTFEVLSSCLQPGCAEGAIVNRLLDLMEQATSTTAR